MNHRISIQIRAAFLLIVFALNTVVGFACAMGMDMGFNSHHHEMEETKSAVHVHADGMKHVHHENAANHDASKHHHSGDEKDNCCHDKVTKIAQSDKAIPQSYQSINPVFFTAFVTAFCDVNLPAVSCLINNNKQYLRSYHPPISNIRIAIQSFQI